MVDESELDVLSHVKELFSSIEPNARIILATHYAPTTIKYANEEEAESSEDVKYDEKKKGNRIDSYAQTNKTNIPISRRSFVSNLKSQLKFPSAGPEETESMIDTSLTSFNSPDDVADEQRTASLDFGFSDGVELTFLESIESSHISDPKANEAVSTRKEKVSSNMEPVSSDKSARTVSVESYYGGNPGLINAIRGLKSLLVRQKDFVIPQFIWIGMLPVDIEEDDYGYVEESINKFMPDHESCVPVWMSTEVSRGFYDRFCKNVLWPIFHTILPNYVEIQPFTESSWKDYVAANQEFARKIVETYRPGDLIWINGYHLMLVPRLLREAIPSATIGFFLHVSFPSSEIFRCLNVKKEVLDGVLGANLLGFLTYTFARQFLQTCVRVLGCETTPNGVEHEGRSTSIQIVPNGINHEQLMQQLDGPSVAREVQSLKERYKNMKILFSNDKLDSTKGIRPRLMSFEQFLTMYPAWVGRVILIQVVSVSAQPRELQGHITELVNRINSKFGSLEYTPVVYLQKDISYTEYLALLTIADVCVITSLKDGMNLMALEFVVAQRHTKNPLILSEFSGSFGSLQGVLPINPWDHKVNHVCMMLLSVYESSNALSGQIRVLPRQSMKHSPCLMKRNQLDTR
jgi:trehalose-6-phosphate synthase